MDTAPSKGPLTVSAIKAATHIIIPCVMETQPVQGLFGMVQLWMQESMQRSYDRPLNLIGILPNMFRNINLHKDLLENLQNNKTMSKYLMPVKLGLRVAFAETEIEDADPFTIFDMVDNDKAKQEALAVCEYVERSTIK